MAESWEGFCAKHVVASPQRRLSCSTARQPGRVKPDVSKWGNVSLELSVHLFAHPPLLSVLHPRSLAEEVAFVY